MKININGITRDITAEEEATMIVTPTEDERIATLKQNLADTDYKAIKYAEGLLNEDEYSEIRAIRIKWRDEINKLEESRGD